MGAFDYVMTQTRNADYLVAFTPEQLAFFHGFPTWVVASWAIAVWGSVLGTLLRLLRKSLAVPVFLASLVEMVITTIHNYGLSNGMEIMGDAFSLAFTGVIFLIALALYFYSRKLGERGMLS